MASGQEVQNNLNELTPEHLLELATRLDTQLKELRSLANDVNKALRACSKLSKNGAFSKKKKKERDPNAPKREPTGFAKPCKVSGELEKFLGLKKGQEIARTEVTKHITKYIKDNNLQNPENKKQILPDKSLQKLLNIGKDEELTYFNLQKYMKHHYPKSNTTAAN